MSSLLIGTNNRGKFIEIAESLSGLPLKLFTPKDLSINEDPEETGTTFEENAVQKARFYHERCGIPTVTDDSGIIVDALKNELGIHTRRWGPGAGATDEEWITYFLKRMKYESNRRASFVCALAFADGTNKIQTFVGKCEGTITEGLEADYLPGLPISGCFRPDGCTCVFSALPIEQKNCTSHRGKASSALKFFLQTQR